MRRQVGWIMVVAALLSQASWAGGMFIGNQISSQVSRTTSSSIAKVLSDRMFVPRLKIKNQAGAAQNLQISPDQRLIALLHEDGTVRIWNTRLGIQRPILRPASGQFKQFLLFSSADWLVSWQTTGELHVYNILNGERLGQLQRAGFNAPVTAMAADDLHSSVWLAFADGAVHEYSLPDFKRQRSLLTDYGERIDYLHVLPDGKQLLLASANGLVARWDIAGQALLNTLSKEDVIQFWPDGENLLVLNDDDELLKFSGDNLVYQIDLDSDFKQPAAAPGLQRIAVLAKRNTIQILNARTLAVEASLKSQQPIVQLGFLNQGRHLLAADREGVVHIYDIDLQKEQVKLISTLQGWSVVDGQGRFDSSEPGLKNVSWEIQDTDFSREIPLDAFSPSHYEPGLLANYIMNQRFINQQVYTVTDGIKLPPKVEVLVLGAGNQPEQLKVKVTVADQGGGIAETRLYHNGKVLPAAAQMSVEEARVDELLVKTFVFAITPVRGANQLKAIASNQQAIEQASHPIDFQFDGQPVLSTLHIVTVGIDRYRDSALNLNYAYADAQAVQQTLKNETHIPYQQIARHTLYNEQASKEGILHKLAQLADVNPEDVLVLYFAGHGIAIEDEWYFMPQETVQQETLAGYAALGLSSRELKQALVNSRAQRIFMMVDACYSGAGLKTFREVENSQRHMSRDLSKSVGLAVLAASRPDQVAMESADLGHGLFTYLVIRGLQGRADMQPADQIVSVQELVDFSQQSMPPFSMNIIRQRGMAAGVTEPQQATAFVLGNDFSLLRVGR
ncbi:MAG: caspase family protein [Methylococcales bacterium]|nr:caspase family protein [Methylococcales bacterium]